MLRLIQLLKTSSKTLDLSQNIIVLAPHPDDETFGCGEMIARAVADGRNVHIVVMSDGSQSHRGCGCNIPPDVLIAEREKNFEEAMSELKIPKERTILMRLPDGSLTEALKNNEAKIARIRQMIIPDRTDIFVPHPLEGMADHIAITELGQQLAREMHCRLFYFCVWSYFQVSFSFRKIFTVAWLKCRKINDPEGHSEKLKAIAVYLGSIAPCGKPWSGALSPDFRTVVSQESELFFPAYPVGK